ncbi:MAG TPA: hypothetical protein VLC28_07345 [Flavitalea sp.]|nr:hypothetical protein [Flavitalea sp.]
MKNVLNRSSVKIGLCLLPYILFASLLIFSSFKSSRLAEDFLKQLGIDKTQADQKISSSILGGYIDAYGASNAMNISVGNRKAVVTDLLKYVKQYVNSEEFKTQYLSLKESNKPQFNKMQTPEEMKQQTIASYKEALASAEQMVKNADAANKPTFQKLVDDTKLALQKAEDPNNKMYVNYAKNYDEMMKNIGEGEKRDIAAWEAKYPADHMQYVKQRLHQFMDETASIDFNAELVQKNGRKYFVKPEYESKSNRWKMAFRAGKEVVEPARIIVQQWITEIEK